MVAVKIDKLVKRYGDLIAVDHLSLSIKKGEIFGLLGPNGSGKSTTINCLLALLSYTKGEIEIFGKPMSDSSYDIKRDIGVVMQNVAVFDELTVYENIDYFCSLYVKDKEERRKCVEYAIDFTGLSEFKKFYPKKLSGGLLRRLNIACGIAHKPSLIIFDEPTVAVDPQSRNKILEGIKELNKNGATVIYTSHYMEEIEQLCTRIAIMDKGKIIASGTKEEIKKMIKNTETITIETISFPKGAQADIRQLPHVYDLECDDDRIVISFDGGDHNLLRVLEYMQKNNHAFGRVYSELPTLNDVFLEITGKTLRD